MPEAFGAAIDVVIGVFNRTGGAGAARVVKRHVKRAEGMRTGLYPVC